MARPEGKYAWTVTVGTKGQIVLPKEARDVFDIKPGDTLIILGRIREWRYRPKINFPISSEKFSANN